MLVFVVDLHYVPQLLADMSEGDALLSRSAVRLDVQLINVTRWHRLRRADQSTALLCAKHVAHQ